MSHLKPPFVGIGDGDCVCWRPTTSLPFPTRSLLIVSNQSHLVTGKKPYLRLNSLLETCRISSLHSTCLGDSVMVAARRCSLNVVY